ncbi:MAG: class I SAM-dependent methyltransferase [Bacillota bacterium]
MKINNSTPELQRELFLIKDPDFWAETWQSAEAASPFPRQRSVQDTVAFWNRRAAQFERNTAGEKSRRRVEKTVHWLETLGVELEGARILDIGAGPGAFTLSFARRAREVVALEPAEKMVAFLQEELKRENTDNVLIIPKPWEGIDPAAEKFTNAFDLVFASMTPGINNKETLLKALECSRRYCYISSFAGKRENDALAQLWPLLFGEAMPSWPGDILYLLNLLYTMGSEMSFQVWEEEWLEESPIDEAAANLLETLGWYGKDTKDLEEKVKDFIREKADGGLFRQKTVTRLGRILVKGKKNFFVSAGNFI